MMTIDTGNLCTKLFLSILLILLISYSILIYSTFKSVENFVNTEVDQQLLENLKLARTMIRSRADMAVSSLSQPASAKPVKQWLKTHNQPLLTEAISRWHAVLPYLDFITVVDAQEQVVARLGNLPPTGEKIGLSDVLKNYLKFRHLFFQLYALALDRQPDAIICVDFSGFNRRFAHTIKRYVRRRRDFRRDRWWRNCIGRIGYVRRSGNRHTWIVDPRYGRRTQHTHRVERHTHSRLVLGNRHGRSTGVDGRLGR